MKLTDYTLNSITRDITGDSRRTPYMTGQNLIELFNSVGIRDLYSGGLPDGLSRNSYTLSRLKIINDSKNLKIILEIIYSIRHFAKDENCILKDAVNEVNKIIMPDGYAFFESQGDYFVSSKDNYPESSTSEVHFQDLRPFLIEELKKAKYLVWVAVAWFTDHEIFSLLQEKRKLGLSVQALILDDKINEKGNIPFRDGFFTMKIKKKGVHENIMHHKFCIIDLKTVIHGSYNWTFKAQYNTETLVIENSREKAEKFADQFMKLKHEEQAL